MYDENSQSHHAIRQPMASHVYYNGGIFRNDGVSSFQFLWSSLSSITLPVLHLKNIVAMHIEQAGIP